MEKVSEEIARVEVTDNLRVCPECDYQRGFHVSLIARQGSEAMSLILICANCGSRFDVGRIICRASACAETGVRGRGACRIRRRAKVGV